MAVLLHFVAAWSSPSRQQRPVVAEAASQLGVEVVEVDIDDDQELAQQFGVRNVPAVALQSDPHSIVVGEVTCDALVAHFQPHVG